MTTTTMLQVKPIDPTHLDRIRQADDDGFGNPIVPFVAEGGEPLRCCLSLSGAGESIAVISYAPLPQPSPWAEVGPVFVHAEACAGYAGTDTLPEGQRTGQKVLRSYRADGTMNYDANLTVPGGEDIEPAVRGLLERPDVVEVHVRAALSQCLAYVVRAESVE